MDNDRVVAGRRLVISLAMAGLIACWGAACSHDTGALGPDKTGGAGGVTSGAGGAAAGARGGGGGSGVAGAAGGVAGATAGAAGAGGSAGTGGAGLSTGAGGGGVAGVSGAAGAAGTAGVSGTGGSLGTGGSVGAGGATGAGGKAGAGGAAGAGGSGGAKNCVDVIKMNGYAYPSAQPCSACIDNGVDKSAACEATIDCLDANYLCSGNCVITCETNAGATAVVKLCVSNLFNASCGSTSTGSGGSGAGGQSGTGPCAGLCSNPTTLTTASATGSNVPAGACYSTTVNIQGAECTNASSFRVNGVAVSCSGTSLSLPAKVMGGYCFQFGPGDPSYALFSTY